PLVEQLLSVDALFRQNDCAMKILSGIQQASLVLSPLGDRLLQRRTERRGVELDEQIPGAHHLTFFKGDLLNVAIDPRPDGHHVGGLNSAQRSQEHEERLLFDARHTHWCWCRPRLRSVLCRRLVRSSFVPRHISTSCE